MSDVNARRWNVLERRSPVLFLLAGVLLVGYAALNGIAAATDLSYVTVEDVVGPAGFVLGFVGLLGLYPALADGRPVLARFGAACVGLGALGFAAITLQGVAVLTGVASPDGPGVFLVLAALGMLPGYLSFGVASLRTDGRSRAVGLLLFVPAVAFGAMLTSAVLFVQFEPFSSATLAWSAVAISGGQAVAHLALGYALRTGESQAGTDAPSADVTVG